MGETAPQHWCFASLRGDADRGTLGSAAGVRMPRFFSIILGPSLRAGKCEYIKQGVVARGAAVPYPGPLAVSARLGPRSCRSAGVPGRSLPLGPAVLGTCTPLGWGHQLSPELQAAAEPGSAGGCHCKSSCPAGLVASEETWVSPVGCVDSLGSSAGLQDAVPNLMPLLARCSSL